MLLKPSNSSTDTTPEISLNPDQWWTDHLAKAGIAVKNGAEVEILRFAAQRLAASCTSSAGQ